MSKILVHLGKRPERSHFKNDPGVGLFGQSNAAPTLPYAIFPLVFLGEDFTAAHKLLLEIT